MARRFTRQRTKRTRVRLRPDEAKNIIEQEFTDSRGNKARLRLDFNPHSPKEPTMDWKRKYGEEQ